MAPTVTKTAGLVHRPNARRTLPRIVPAIPHRLTRQAPAARPVTPDDSSKGITKQEPDAPEQVASKHEQRVEPQVLAVEAPMTPDSPASPTAKSDVEAPLLATSPANSGDDHVEHTADAGTPGLVDDHDSLDLASTEDAGADQINGTSTSLPPQESDSKSLSGSNHRKFTVPTELPPPFYPSTKPDNLTSPSAIADIPHGSSYQHHMPYEEPTAQAHTQVIQGSAPSKHVQNELPAPRLPPGFGPPEFTPTFYTGHSHHPSDMGGPWPIHPNSVAVTEPAYAASVQYQSAPAGPPETSVHLNAYSKNFSLAPALNGTGSSHSQSPSKTQLDEHRASSERGDDMSNIPYQNGPSFKGEQLEQTPFELAAYLLGQVGNPEFADFVLQVRSLETTLTSLPVHGIVVVRSPVIADAISRSVPNSHRAHETRRLLDIVARDSFVTRESVEEAIRVLYGAPLLSAQAFLYGIAPEVFDSSQAHPTDAPRRMRQLLSYIAAGRVLQLSSMQHRGVELARALLRWDTVDQVLQFALRFRLGQYAVPDSPEDPFDTALLNYAIDFIVHTVPSSFKLYTVAPELQDIPRLRTRVESRTTTHNPRLSKIRFGDAPLEDELKPTHCSRVLSSILLTLPLPLIDRVLNHPATANQLGWSRVVEVMQDVVTERENRRKKAAASQVKLPHNGTTTGALSIHLHAVEHVEQVEPSPLHPSGYTLVATHGDD